MSDLSNYKVLINKEIIGILDGDVSCGTYTSTNGETLSLNDYFDSTNLSSLTTVTLTAVYE